MDCSETRETDISDAVEVAFAQEDAIRVWLKEVSVGAINGVVLGILVGIVFWIWKRNAYLGLVVGLALASDRLLTTITDMAGFFLALSLATLMMPLLLN
ncbi:magnesium transporter [Litoreibacter arenae]|uniref:Magnesium transporter Ykok n=1 Tax=Litoreibacter arenae DSM 19593 TaxID=1123360 RepID=S9QCG5_9RHOB|nr:magnesium transporter [Litoreibacter arenae]EPX77298.1 magnesium transporter Ykok [Litoreibacter arenae DSM 19593]